MKYNKIEVETDERDWEIENILIENNNNSWFTQITIINENSLKLFYNQLNFNKEKYNAKYRESDIFFIEEYLRIRYKISKSKYKTYIIKDFNTGLYKIGKSLNPKIRERTLQSEKPTIKMIKIFDEDIEKELHKQYKDFRVRGEWFNLNKIQVHYICSKY